LAAPSGLLQAYWPENQALVLDFLSALSTLLNLSIAKI
jgi:hypothetical protein